VVVVAVVPAVAFMNGGGLGSSIGSVTAIDVVVTTPNGTAANEDCIRFRSDWKSSDSTSFVRRFRILLLRLVRQWPYDDGLLVVVNAAAFTTTTGDDHHLRHGRCSC
jgi:hypothetical protein